VSCGCQGTAESNDRRRTNAVMCCVCPRRHKWTHCSVDGRPCLSRTCPKDRHDDGDGTLVWFWVRWYGVPFPIRAVMRTPIWMWIGGLPLSGTLVGCGCVKRLKDWWETMANRG
jgi:hypothetical protein